MKIHKAQLCSAVLAMAFSSHTAIASDFVDYERDESLAHLDEAVVFDGFDDDYSDVDIDPGYAPLDSNEDNYWEFDEILLNGKRVKNTKKRPASAIVYLESEEAFQGGQIRCSGFLVGHKTVVTAGHCVFDHLKNGKSGYNKGIYVYPGRNGSKQPFGRCKALYKWTPKQWQEKKNYDYDYGILSLDCNIGKKAGRLGYSKSSKLKNRSVRLNTYSSGNGKEQWRYSTKIEKVNSRDIKYNYTGHGHGGSSGSPIYIPNEDDCGSCAVGIHSRGKKGKKPETGVKINSNVFKHIKWMKNKYDDEG